MQIRIKETGAVVFEQGFRAMHPNTSMPQQLTEAAINELGGDVVFEGPQASGGTVYQYSQRDGVEQLDGKWYTKYVAGPIFTDTPEATAAEQEAAYKARLDDQQATSVRADRNARLAATDWRVIKALEEGNGLNFDVAAYRQALRDVPSQPGFPWNVVWPVLA
jgi:hypothetical protein